MIVYLHGFSSGAASQKATRLKQALAPIVVFVPEYPSHQPRSAVAMLVKCIRQQTAKSGAQKILLIGSSLGGFYAQYLAARLDCVSGVVLINPALQPRLTLKPYIGRQTNLVTGETFEFREKDFQELAEFHVPANKINVPTLVLLDEGDDVIDYRFAAQQYQKIGRVIVYPGGSHWFDHLDDAIPHIRKFYDDLC
ncbi:YqiA/YcfP family alpha/beta fold hydrolase [Kaarinaea lacus]